MLQLIDSDQEVVNHLLFTEEANFHLSGGNESTLLSVLGVQESKLSHHRSTSLAEGDDLDRRVERWSTWALFLRRNGDNYLDMLRDQFLPQLKEIEDFRLIFIQDEAPPHWKQDVREWLDENFPGSWV